MQRKRKRSAGIVKPSVNSSDSGDSSQQNGSDALMAVMQRLDMIASEGKHERDRLARQSQADREHFKAAIAAINARAPLNDVLSDDDAEQTAVGPRPKSTATGSRGRLTPLKLQCSPNQMQGLRDDHSKARTVAGSFKSRLYRRTPKN